MGQERILGSGEVLADSWRMNRNYSSKEKEGKFQKRRYLVQKSGCKRFLMESSKDKEKPGSHMAICGSHVSFVKKKDISSDGFKQKRACVTEQTGVT